jgi:hypothetical protein
MELKDYYLKVIKHLETGCDLEPASEAVIRLHSQQQQSALEANLEVTSSPGVEGLDDSHTHPLVTKAPARKKRKRKQTKTRDERRQQKKADNKAGGARRVKSKSANREANPNDRTCLAKAITAHISDEEKQESFIKAAIKAKPKDRDTSPGDLFQVLATHGLSLQRASKDYFLPGSPRCQHLLKEVDCALVVHLLLDRKHSHFVAWDGKTIHDDPYSLEISRMDRTTSKASEAVFSKLYQDCEEWDITAVYRLSIVLAGEGPDSK